MDFNNQFSRTLLHDEDFRRDELTGKIEHALQKLTLQELESLYYDMMTKNYIHDAL